MRKLWVVYFFAIAVSAGAASATTVDVSIQGFAFTPSSVTISAGDTVRWTHNDAFAIHTVTSDTLVFDSGFLNQNQTFSYTFSTPGTFPYHCNIHVFMTGTITVIGNKSDTTTSLTTTNANTVYGQNATLTAAVTATPPASGTPTGTVTFLDGVSPLCQSAALNGSGIASCSTVPLIPGPRVITAMYNGDSTFNTSTSNTVQQNVAEASTATTLNSSLNPSIGGQNVTFTATASIDPPGSGNPTGTITFNDAANPICAGVAMVAGSAQCAKSSLAPGDHSISATYSGDSNLTGSTSAPLIQTVRLAAPTGLSALSGDPNSPFVSVGFDPSQGATGYEVGRRTVVDGVETIFSTGLSTGYADHSVSPDTTYIYRARAIGPGGPSEWSNVDIGSTFFATLPSSGTPILKTGMESMRHDVNKVRFAAHLPDTVFGDTPLVQNVTNVKGTHVLELRHALNEALLIIGVPLPQYTDTNESLFVSGTLPVKGTHLIDLILVME